MRTLDRLKALAPTLSIGVLTADWMSLGQDLARLEGSGVGVLHFDVLDGCFAPGLTLGPPLIRAIRTDLLKDVHLLVADPLDKVEAYVRAGADIVTVHVEAAGDPAAVLDRLAGLENANDPARGLVRGVAINPDTDLARLTPLRGQMELVVVLAVDPIHGRHPTPEQTAARFQEIRALMPPDTLLCLDGGVKPATIDAVAALRPDLVVSGSAVFDGKAPRENAVRLLERLRMPR